MFCFFVFCYRDLLFNRGTEAALPLEKIERAFVSPIHTLKRPGLLRDVRRRDEFASVCLNEKLVSIILAIIPVKE